MDDPEYASKLFDQYFTSGYVFKTPTSLLLGGPHPTRADAWHVAWAEVSPNYPHSHTLSVIAHFIGLMPHYRPFITWERSGRGRSERTFSTDVLLRLTKA